MWAEPFGGPQVEVQVLLFVCSCVVRPPGQMSEEDAPKTGGVKAMLAALNKKNADSHVVLPDGTVPSGQGAKMPWRAPTQDSSAPGLRKPEVKASAASSGGVENKVPGQQPGGQSVPGESLTEDEMRAVREAVAAKRSAARSPAAGQSRPGPPAGSENSGRPGSESHSRGPLPEGWEQKQDPKDGKVFWVNHAKKLRSWTDPRQGAGRGRGRGWFRA